MALYSASAEDLATVPCFLDFQLIGELFNKITKSEIGDFQLFLASESE